MKKKRFLALLLSAVVAVSAIPAEAFAEGQTEAANKYAADGYKLVWSDEFNGTELDRSVWNVETHEAGWVNSELQEYVDSEENISLKDGYLNITPVKKVELVEDTQAGNLLKNADFANGKEGWTETIANWGGDEGFADASSSYANGVAKFSIKNPGHADWAVQLKQTGIKLEAGKTYVASYDIETSVARQIKSGIMSASYEWFGGSDPVLTAGKQTITYEFTMSKSDNGDFYISLGKVGDTPAGDISISNISLLEKSATPVAQAKETVSVQTEETTITAATETQAPKNLLSNADFAAGKEGWTETIGNWGAADEGNIDATGSYENGVAKYVINNPGDFDWSVQLEQSGILLQAGKTYKASYDIETTVDRDIKSGVMNDSYKWYGGSDPSIKVGKQTISYEFTMPEDSSVNFYISLGKVGETPAGEIIISNPSLTESVSEEGSSETPEVKPEDKPEEKPAETPVVKPTTPTKEKVSYTSGRISTQNLQTFTYGKFECRAKVPAGQGYLPAFWLMANDENIYGQWPRCGEIDCMEVMGQDTTKAYGTIHYGNPHSESQGTYVVDAANSFSNEFHTYTCEWEPGKITWFIDGIKFHEESDWYSTTVGQGTLTYPAPFDQPFYIILNLAVGGSWVGNPDANTSFDNNPFTIDYVRVYQKDSYDENVTKPVKETIIREPNANGNYLNNGDFSVAEDLTDDVDWKFLTALEGVGSASIENNEIVIKTENDGTADYSIQLVQPNVPLVKGATYEVSFDAYASADREMGVDVKAPDHGYKAYMPHKTAALTTTKQTYTYTFEMADDTDSNGRLEYNMGATGSKADIHISNVTFKKTADPDPNKKETKTVLSNGNYIYNGSFAEGDKHLGYWDITASKGVAYSVTSFADSRRFTTDLKSGKALTLTQKDLAISEGASYEFTADIEVEKAGKAVVSIGGNNYTLNLNAGKETYKIAVSPKVTFTNKNVSIKLTGANKYYLDNVKLTSSALLKNGSFSDGMTSFEVYVDSSAKASSVVDSLTEDNALDITITNTGDADWKVQVKQNNIPLKKGETYTLTFKAKSSIPRKVRALMQGDESHGWAVYSNDNVLALTSEYQTFTDTFTMNADTDLGAFLSICLGAVGDEVITESHRVCIDDITLTSTDDSIEYTTPDKPVKNNNSNSSSDNTSSTTVNAGNVSKPSSTTNVTNTTTNTNTTSTTRNNAATAATNETTTEDTTTDVAEETTEEVTEEKPEEIAEEVTVEEPETPLAADEEVSQPEAQVSFFGAIINAIVNFFKAIANFFRR